jgi:hypothetical protein
MTRMGSLALKLLLLGISALCLLSSGGLLIFLFLPLAAGYWWAIRHAGTPERLGWLLVGAVAAAEWAWEVTYPVTEGAAPATWLIALTAAATMTALLIAGTRYRLAKAPS